LGFDSSTELMGGFPISRSRRQKAAHRVVQDY
jgi:hypothetical protein